MSKKSYVSRREFITRASLSLVATGLAPLDSLELAQRLAKKYLPLAEAQEGGSPTRIIEIGLRAGVPLIYLGTGKEFKSLTTPRYPNCPFSGNSLTDSGNNLHLNTSTTALAPYAANIAITQGIANEDGHTDLFSYRKGGGGKNELSPIIEVINRNNSYSLMSGVQFGESVTSNTLGKPDLQKVNTATFFDYFKKPSLLVPESEADIIAKASRDLSRKQALLLERAQKNAVPISNYHNAAVSLMTTDFSSVLNFDGIPSGLTTGRKGRYADAANSLAMTLKAMSLNLINSSLIAIDTGDWHGFQTIGSNPDFPSEMAAILASTIDYLKATPEPASTKSETLWDTTLIVVGSEFTRGISPVGSDNNDGATQGVMLIGKRVRGGYYGGFTLSNDGSAPGIAHGFDLVTGETTPNKTVTNEGVYHTTNALLGNSGFDLKKVFKCMIG